MIGYDSDKEDTNCKVFESGDIFEEAMMTNTSNNIFTTKSMITRNIFSFMFLNAKSAM